MIEVPERFAPYHPDHLSFSQLEAYERCAWYYWLRYVKKVPEPPNFYAQFGTLMHRLFERDGRHRMRTGRGLPKSHLEQAFERHFDPSWFDTPEQASVYFTKGRRMIDAYLAFSSTTGGRDPDLGPRVLAVEQPFRLHPSFGVPVVGFVDRIERRGNEYWVVDYKTGRPFSDQDSRADQLLLYGLAFYQRYRRRPRWSVYYFLDTDTVLVGPELTKQAVTNLRKRFARMLQSLRAGEFHRTCASSFWCQHICGYGKTGMCPLAVGRNERGD